MYYSGFDPLTGDKVYTAKDPMEKRMQRALMQYRDPKNYQLVYRALIKEQRQDLIGYGPKCLIRPPKKENDTSRHSNAGKPTFQGRGKRIRG
jgi:hypothetical protein